MLAYCLATLAEPFVIVELIQCLSTPDVVVVLTLITFNVLLLLDPVVTLLANLHGVECFCSEVMTTLVLELVILNEIVDSDAELLGTEVRMVFAEPADLPLKAFFEGKLFSDVLDSTLAAFWLSGRFLFAHKII